MSVTINMEDEAFLAYVRDRAPYGDNKLAEEFFRVYREANILRAYDDDWIGTACLVAARTLAHPTPRHNPRGRTQSGIRVYSDQYGFMSSGYTIVESGQGVSWSSSADIPKSEYPIVWDKDPEADALFELRKLFWEWEWHR